MNSLYFILSVESTIEMTGNKNLTEITKLNQIVLLFVWVSTVESVRKKNPTNYNGRTLDPFYNFIVLYDLHSWDAEFRNVNYESQIFILNTNTTISLAFWSKSFLLKTHRWPLLIKETISHLIGKILCLWCLYWKMQHYFTGSASFSAWSFPIPIHPCLFHPTLFLKETWCIFKKRENILKLKSSTLNSPVLISAV